MNSLGIDLIVFVRMDELDNDIIAHSAPKLYDKKSLQPLVGVITINNKIDLNKYKSQEFFQSVMVHEFIHILGFNPFYLNYFHFVFTKKNPDGITKTYINSTKVINVGKKYFNCQQIDGIELDDYYNSSHWETRILLGDIMNTIIYQEEQVISEFTLALLEDLGYYKAKYYTGGLMRYGKNKGNDFLEQKSVKNGQINPLFEIEQSCSSGRQSIMYNLMYKNTISPNSKLETKDRYYVGHCLKGQVDFGSPNSNIGSSSQMGKYTGETYSNHSFCSLSSISKEKNNLEVRAGCYEMFCSSKSLTIKIFDEYIVCPRRGGKINIEGYKGYFLCPDYNLICSGTKICNDLFDCIEKKSEIKESSYKYDYEIETSQNMEKSEVFDNENNYELSDDGVCPQNCSKCLKKNYCLKCKKGYALVELKNNTIICKNEQALKTGYYKENSIYHPCKDNCDICQNGESCQQCQKGYLYNNKSCKKTNLIENCAEYNNDGSCKKCKNNIDISVDEPNKYKCKNPLEEYYTKNGGISYHLCDGEGKNHIKHCSKCIYNKKLVCNECKNGYFILDDKTDKCYPKDNKNNTYYFINDTHAKTCSKSIDNCHYCESEKKCIKCHKGFFFLNNKNDKCYSEKELTLSEYFFNKDNNTFLSCNNSLYHSVENCKKCNNQYSCLKCKEDFTFINRNKNKCFNISLLKGEYYPDPKDKTNYLKCTNLVKNCLKCNSSQCLLCEKEYIFINDNFAKCHLKSSIHLDDYYTNDNITYYHCKDKRYKDNPKCQKQIIPTISPKPTNPSNIDNESDLESINIDTNIPTDFQTKSTDLKPINSDINIYTELKSKSTSLKFDSIKASTPSEIQTKSTNFESSIFSKIKIKSTNLIESDNPTQLKLQSTSFESDIDKSIHTDTNFSTELKTKSTYLESDTADINIPTELQTESTSLESDNSDTNIPTELQTDSTSLQSDNSNINIPTELQTEWKSLESDTSDKNILTELQTESTSIQSDTVDINIPSELQTDSTSLEFDNPEIIIPTELQTESTFLESDTADTNIPTASQIESTSIESDTADTNIPTELQTESKFLQSDTIETNNPTELQIESTSLQSDTADKNIPIELQTDSTFLESDTADKNIPTELQTESSSLESNTADINIPTELKTESTFLQSDTADKNIPTELQTESTSLESDTTDINIPTELQTESTSLESDTTDINIPTELQTESTSLESNSADINIPTELPTESIFLESDTADRNIQTELQTDSTFLESNTADTNIPTELPTESTSLDSDTADTTIPTELRTDSTSLQSDNPDINIPTEMQTDSTSLQSDNSEINIPTELQINSTSLQSDNSEININTELQIDSTYLQSDNSEINIPTELQTDFTSLQSDNSDINIPTELQIESTSLESDTADTNIPTELKTESTSLQSDTADINIPTELQTESTFLQSDTADTNIPTELQTDSTFLKSDTPDTNIPTELQIESTSLHSDTADTNIPTELQTDSTILESNTADTNIPTELQTESTYLEPDTADKNIPTELQTDSTSLQSNTADTTIPTDSQTESTSSQSDTSDTTIPTELQTESSSLQSYTTDTNIPTELQTDSTPLQSDTADKNIPTELIQLFLLNYTQNPHR